MVTILSGGGEGEGGLKLFLNFWQLIAYTMSFDVLISVTSSSFILPLRLLVAMNGVAQKLI